MRGCAGVRMCACVRVCLLQCLCLQLLQLVCWRFLCVCCSVTVYIYYANVPFHSWSYYILLWSTSVPLVDRPCQTSGPGYQQAGTVLPISSVGVSSPCSVPEVNMNAVPLMDERNFYCFSCETCKLKGGSEVFKFDYQHCYLSFSPALPTSALHRPGNFSPDILYLKQTIGSTASPVASQRAWQLYTIVIV